MKVCMSNSEPKSISPWEAVKWEMYLSTLEVPQRETLTRKYDELCENLVAEDDIESKAEDEDAVAGLRISLLSLSLQQRVVLHAKYWEGRSEREIAARLGISRSTVQVHLRRAIRHLQRHLSSKFPRCERAQNLFPHNVCPARTETQEERDE